MGHNAQWANPDLFDENFILRPRGMHFLMGYIGAVGVLMSRSGLEEVMQDAFGSLKKMLTGNNFPQNTRALRIVKFYMKFCVRSTLLMNLCRN